MKKLLLFLLLMTVKLTGKAQIKEPDCILPIEIFPEFKGGMKALQLFLKKNIKYPNGAGCVRGKVYVEFIVEKNGKITHPTILKSLSEECDAEALRVVKLMPKWIPGRRFKSSRFKFTLPIKFEIAE
ncbi:MAG: TonB family protein [Arcicella sp.]|nr:TonB family protein [Arcicella sp.]